MMVQLFEIFISINLLMISIVVLICIVLICLFRKMMLIMNVLIVLMLVQIVYVVFSGSVCMVSDNSQKLVVMVIRVMIEGVSLLNLLDCFIVNVQMIFSILVVNRQIQVMWFFLMGLGCFGQLYLMWGRLFFLCGVFYLFDCLMGGLLGSGLYGIQICQFGIVCCVCVRMCDCIVGFVLLCSFSIQWLILIVLFVECFYGGFVGFL